MHFQTSRFLEPDSEVPISRLEHTAVFKRLVGIGLALVTLLLLFFIVYAQAGLKLSPQDPNLLFGYMDLLVCFVSLALFFRGAVVGAVRLFVPLLLLAVLAQPFFVHADNVMFSFMVNPIIALSLLMIVGLVFSRTTLYILVALVIAAIGAAVLIRGDAAIRVRLPLVVSAGVGAATAFYLWNQTIDQALNRERKAAREAEQRARERDLMMRETHHRIKNNLGIVNALIHLRSQSRHTELGIQELSRQIRTIMVLHEKLHRQEQQVNSVGLARHLRDVLDIVFSTSEGTGIDYSVNIGEGVAVDPKSAVPLGLIINELAMNALKYSFPGAEERRFVVRGEREAPSGQYLLTVTHSGPPLPEEFSFEREDTVGLQLVSALIQQLDGSIELQRSPEPAFMFRIPLH